MPLFLLMASLNIPLAQTLNREFIAEEIVRTLVGSLGLILAVPVTSLLAGLVAQESRSGGAGLMLALMSDQEIIAMPRLVKGGKWVYGWVIVGPG